MTKEEIMEAIENMTVLELSELVKAMEDKFGVSAAAPLVAVGHPFGSACLEFRYATELRGPYHGRFLSGRLCRLDADQLEGDRLSATLRAYRDISHCAQQRERQRPVGGVVVGHSLCHSPAHASGLYLAVGT